VRRLVIQGPDNAYLICFKPSWFGEESQVKFREVVKIVERDGWILKRSKGSHFIYAHPAKPGRVILANHGPKDIPEGTLKNILKQAGLEN
jgi:predicted RNA binding protein YcfA (HicA-like mRNA interferase family)